MLGVSVNSLDKNSNDCVDSNIDRLVNYPASPDSGLNRGGGNQTSTQDLIVESNGGRRGFRTPDDILFADNSGTTIRIVLFDVLIGK